MVLWFEPASGSVQTARSLEPASDSVPPSLWPSPTHAVSHSLSQKQINIKKIFLKRIKSPEINPYIHGQLIFSKDAETTQWEKNSLLNKSC